jgi:hypothetical protein
MDTYIDNTEVIKAYKFRIYSNDKCRKEIENQLALVGNV